MTWDERKRIWKRENGREPTTDELLVLSRDHDMTPAEIDAQRKSWVRANAPTGDPRFD